MLTASLFVPGNWRMYSVIYTICLRLWYENTEVCMVPAEPPLPSPTAYKSKLGDIYTDGSNGS